MKLLMIIVDTDCREELEVLFQRNDVTGYTELAGAHGIGETGVRMGSRAHPKTSSVFFTVVEDETVPILKENICNYCEACDKHMKMIQWGVEEVI
jgi:hypothetical protein